MVKKEKEEVKKIDIEEEATKFKEIVETKIKEKKLKNVVDNKDIKNFYEFIEINDIDIDSDIVKIIFDAVNVAYMRFGQEIVFTNPTVTDEERVSCLLRTFMAESCEYSSICRKKTSNRHIETVQLPVIIDKYGQLLSEEYRRTTDEVKKEKIFKEIIKLSEIPEKIQFKTFCEHKGDISQFLPGKEFQVPAIDGRYYRLRGYYYGPLMSRIVIFSPSLKPKTLIITARGLTPESKPPEIASTKFWTFLGKKFPTFYKMSNYWDFYKAGETILCSTELVTVYGMKVKLFNETIEFTEKQFDMNKNDLEELKKIRIHKGILNMVLAIFNDIEFQRMLESVMVYYFKDLETGEIIGGQFTHTELIFTSFSMGSALVQVLAFLVITIFIPYIKRIINDDYRYSKIKCIILGSPKVGNYYYANFLNSRIEVFNFISGQISAINNDRYISLDPVTLLPSNSSQRIQNVKNCILSNKSDQQKQSCLINLLRNEYEYVQLPNSFIIIEEMENHVLFLPLELFPLFQPARKCNYIFISILEYIPKYISKIPKPILKRILKSLNYVEGKFELSEGISNVTMIAKDLGLKPKEFSIEFENYLWDVLHTVNYYEDILLRIK